LKVGAQSVPSSEPPLQSHCSYAGKLLWCLGITSATAEADPVLQSMDAFPQNVLKRDREPLGAGCRWLAPLVLNSAAGL